MILGHCADCIDIFECWLIAKAAARVTECEVCAGMAGVLNLLKDRGELTQRMQWAGRTNDMKPVMLQGLEEVYQSGAHSDEIANRVELALTRRDEYGRVLTPKQAFREVSYR